MCHKEGFTLLELLIAAALISVLAMFATQAYRASASSIRVEDAKARALLLLNAAQRYYTEYPNAPSFSTGDGNPLTLFVKAGACQPNSSGVQQLVNCGFLEYRQVAQESKGHSGSMKMWFKAITPGTADVTVCFTSNSNRVTDTCTYCTDNGADFTTENCN